MKCSKYLLPPANEVCGKVMLGNVFTGVCDSVHGGGGAWSRGRCLLETPPPQTATDAGGTHPTGMHSCFF